MTFLDFCRLHGVIIDTLPAPGRWRRYKTTDKPGHRNGAVKYMGDHGFVQNHATMTDVSTWRNEGESSVAMQEVQRSATEAARLTAGMNAQAAQRALSILGKCELATHPYTASKGFPDELVNVWKEPGEGALCVIPMRIGSDLVGCQLIDEAGDKKFLYGQRSGGAQFIFDNQGQHILCEGYATALSARHALKNLKKRYTLHVCFSAGNMLKVAAPIATGFLLADNDASGTGERVAKEIGWPYWMSDTVGEDFNDCHRRIGLFAVGQSLNRVMRMSG